MDEKDLRLLLPGKKVVISKCEAAEHGNNVGCLCSVMGRTFTVGRLYDTIFAGTPSWYLKGSDKRVRLTEITLIPKPEKAKAPRKPSQREDGPRTKFSVEKASEGGWSFADAKAALEAAGVVDIRKDYSPYVGQYGLSVPKRFEDKANDVLFGKG